MLTWLWFCPLAVALGTSTWALNSLQHPGCEQLAGERFIAECEPRLGTGFLGVAALSVLAAVPFAVLVAVLHRWWAARRPGRAYISWCGVVAGWCLGVGLLLGNFDGQLPHGGRTYYFVVQWVLLAGAGVFGLTDARRRRPLRIDPPRV